MRLYSRWNFETHDEYQVALARRLVVFSEQVKRGVFAVDLMRERNPGEGRPVEVEIKLALCRGRRKPCRLRYPRRKAGLRLRLKLCATYLGAALKVWL